MAPYEQTFYSVAPVIPDANDGYWATYAVGPVRTGNLPPFLIDALYKSLFFRPTSSQVVGAYDLAGEIFRTGGKRLLTGEGLAH